MKKTTKEKLAAILGTAAVMSLINSYIDEKNEQEDHRDEGHQKTWTYRNQAINYTVQGEGSPILLLHGLSIGSSSIEWSEVIPLLARKYKVYAFDFLGFGYSDKPDITYTGYLLTDMINAFIKEVIKEKVSLVASGSSAGFALCARQLEPKQIKKIILVNPTSPDLKQPNAGLQKILGSAYKLPIMGRFSYNMHLIMDRFFFGRYFYKPQNVSRKLMQRFYRNANRSKTGAIAAYTSQLNHMTAVPVSEFIKNADDLSIIYGKYWIEEFPVLKKYKQLNAGILFAPIADSRKFPQLEMPDSFVSQVEALL